MLKPGEASALKDWWFKSSGGNFLQGTLAGLASVIIAGVLLLAVLAFIDLN